MCRRWESTTCQERHHITGITNERASRRLYAPPIPCAVEELKTWLARRWEKREEVNILMGGSTDSLLLSPCE